MSFLALVPPLLREAWRTGLFVIATILSAVVFGLAVVIGPLSLGTGDRILRDFGLASLVITTGVIVLVGGIHLVCREIERRTVLVLLARPISRTQYLLGKFAGLVALAWITLAIAAGVFAAGFHLRGVAMDAALVQASFLAALEVMVLASLALLYGTIANAIPAMVYALATFVAGHAMSSLASLTADATEGPTRVVMTALKWLFPDLSRFDMRLQAVHGLTVSALDLCSATAYACVYTAAVLCLACAAFARREFK